MSAIVPGLISTEFRMSMPARRVCPLEKHGSAGQDLRQRRLAVQGGSHEHRFAIQRCPPACQRRSGTHRSVGQLVAGPHARRITDGLGERWETQRIAIKPYAAMGALHAPLDAIFHLMKQRSLGHEEIDRVDIYMSHAAYHHGWWKLERPLTPIAAQMNVAYAIAV